MELQARFGTDERFRMDSHFLEESEEEELGETVCVCGIVTVDEIMSNLIFTKMIIKF